MPNPFATSTDVATALLRPLTDLESTYIDGLIEQASDLLRNAAPALDDRISRYLADPKDRSGISRGAVAAVVAGAVKRYLVNPNGLASHSTTVGPYSETNAYALRSDKDTRGALEITDGDLKTLFPNRRRTQARTIRITPSLAPRPVGRYGPIPTPGEAFAAVIDYNTGQVPIGEDSFYPSRPS